MSSPRFLLIQDRHREVWQRRGLFAVVCASPPLRDSWNFVLHHFKANVKFNPFFSQQPPSGWKVSIPSIWKYSIFFRRILGSQGWEESHHPVRRTLAFCSFLGSLLVSLLPSFLLSWELQVHLPVGWSPASPFPLRLHAHFIKLTHQHWCLFFSKEIILSLVASLKFINISSIITPTKSSPWTGHRERQGKAEARHSQAKISGRNMLWKQFGSTSKS